MLSPVLMEEVSKIIQSKQKKILIFNPTSGSIHGKNVCFSQNRSLTSVIQLLQSISESTINNGECFCFD